MEQEKGSKHAKEGTWLEKMANEQLQQLSTASTKQAMIDVVSDVMSKVLVEKIKRLQL